ncbi:helix-turn-helix domain-containing protein [Quadrisphaera sp. INWT6]|uniref:helix-turn-helix domain-containing protein n=1 Tax=Quadrisphaera sp. INWT6 TaxID=2596917 RepID=UPI0018921536|nr:helix-turn-helix domain-containing protein [Quadrisphaera sp. INWT6]MBF5083746.1 helix-turn-helix domain-containing protein [Quadrisphaera sp. INWT6]
MPLPVTYTPDEVAAALGVKRRWLMEAAASDPARFPSVKLAGRVLFTEEQVRHILQAATRQAPTQPARELTQAERAAQAWGRPPPRRPRRPSRDQRPEEWR